MAIDQEEWYSIITRIIVCGRGGIGRRARLKIWFLKRSVGSSPTARTIVYHEQSHQILDNDFLCRRSMFFYDLQNN